MVDRLLAHLEDAILQNLVDNYPKWSLSKHFIFAGQWLEKNYGCPVVDEEIIRARHTLSRHLIMAWALAKHGATKEWSIRADSFALAYFRECYFLKMKEEAIPFFTCLFYPRHCIRVVGLFISRLLSWKPKEDNAVLDEDELDYMCMIAESPER
jgi:hypothetical protein